MTGKAVAVVADVVQFLLQELYMILHLDNLSY